MSYGFVTSCQNPTCTEQGWAKYTCTVKNCGQKGIMIYEPRGHSKHLSETEKATCTTNQYNKYVCRRFRCNYISKEEVKGTMLGHDFSDQNITVNTIGTCTERGYLKKKCSRCKEEIDCTPSPLQGSIYASKGGHNYERRTQQPTCVQAGWVHNVCLRCGYEKDVTPGSSQGSPYAPTGKHNYVNGKCIVCGTKSGSSSTGSTSTHYHTWKDATCEEPKKCTSCGQTSGNSLGHNYDSNGICTRCGEIKSESGENLNTWDLTGNGTTATVGSIVAVLTDDGTLTINGDGTICNYDRPSSPNAKYLTPITGRCRIKKVHITGKLNNIATYLFYYCSNIEEVIIDNPETIQYIGEGAFWGCTKLKTFKMPQNVTQIGAKAFCHCHDLEEIDLTTAPNLTRIGHEAFRDCWLLETVKMPEGLKIIGYEAFLNCISLKNVVIPSTVISMGTLGTSEDPNGIGNEGQFTGDKTSENTKGYNNVFTIDFSRNVGQENEYKSYQELVLARNGINNLNDLLTKTRVWYYPTSTMLETYASQKASNELKISQLSFDISEKQDNSITATIDVNGKLTITGSGKIKDYEDKEIPWKEIRLKITSVEFSEGITTIGKHLLYYHENLQSAKLPNTLEEIHYGAFFGCKALTAIDIPSNVKKIDAYAFCHCENLQEITIPKNVNKLLGGTFRDCYKLTSVKTLGDIITLGDMEFYNCPELKLYIVSPYIIEIGEKVFALDSSLTSTGKVEYYEISKVMSDYVTANPSERTFEKKDIDGLAVKTKPTKLEYYKNDILDTEGLVLNVSYYNGSTKDNTLIKEVSEDLICTPTELDKEGTQTITVTYAGKTTTFNVEVKKVEVKDVFIKQQPTKFNYNVGESINTEGLILTVVYNNGTTKEITEGFTFTPTKVEKEGIQEITVAYEGKTNTFVVGVSAGELTNIEVKAKPNKTVYTVGDTVDLTGLILKLTYNTGFTKEITEEFICTPTKLDKEGTQTITVTYGEKTTTFTVTVKAPTLSSIAVKTKPSKVTYTLGETLNTTGLVLTATYSNGTTKEITEGFTCTPTKLDKEGTQTITVTYGEKTTTFTVTVKAPTLSSIAVKTKPSKVTYTLGETLNTTGLVLTATYSNGTTKEITEGFTCTPTKLDKEGTQTITVTYEEKTTTFTVTVKAPILSSIAVKTKPSKVTYTLGETLNTTGLVLTATYSNGTTKEITEGFTCTPTKLDKEGTQTITVTYEGKTATFTVTVNKNQPETIYVTSNKYNVEPYYIKNIEPETTVKTLKEKLLTNEKTEVVVKNNGTTLKETDYIGTGMKITFKLGEETKEYTLVVTGDITGDGKIQNGDLIKLVRYRVELITLEEPYKLAADVNGDGKVADSDIIKLARALVEIK